MGSLIRLSQKQNEYIVNADRRWNLKVGAVRSGKSFVDVNVIIPYRLRQGHGKSGLNVILGVSRETIERNVLQPMREMYTERLVGTINGRNIATICGEDVYCLGAEKISQVAKIQGASIKYCYGDEIAKWNDKVFSVLKSRLDKEYSCFDGACNPESPNHWLKTFIDNEELDSYIQHYTIFDNPHLPQAFVENLCKEYEGTVYYSRYIEGEWTMAEGLIYPMYEDVIVKELPDAFEEYSMSIDYGTQNAFAAVLWALHDGVWYGVNEYYYSGRETGTQKTDDEYWQDLEIFLDNYFGEERPGRIETIIDPSATSFITLLKKKGGYRVRTADNNVADGLRDTAVVMNRGKLKVYYRLKNWINEVQGYAWEPGRDAPVKVNDHAMDATRYFVRTRHLAKIRREYDSLLRS